MLVRCIDVSIGGADISLYSDNSFADKSLISSWAAAAVNYSFDHGIMRGVGDNRIDPRGKTTCEQAILLTYRVYINRALLADNNLYKISESDAAKIQSAIKSAALKYGAAGIQTSIIYHGAAIDFGAFQDSFNYGVAVKHNTPMSSTTKIRVASISKAVLALLAVKLDDIGLIDVDADISEYWGFQIRNPNYLEIPITTRHILTHSSSIASYGSTYDARGEVIENALRNGTCFSNNKPGSTRSWLYSNYAYAALGLMIEKYSGRTINDLADQYLFSPLNIDAAYGTGSISDVGNLAELYTKDGSVSRSLETLKNTFGSTYPMEWGGEYAGGLAISAYDLAKLFSITASRGNDLVSPDSVSLLESVYIELGDFDQCLALRHQKDLYGEDELFYIMGSNYGVHSLMSYNPITGNGVIVLTTGTSETIDKYGIYDLCGAISESIFAVVRDW